MPLQHRALRLRSFCRSATAHRAPPHFTRRRNRSNGVSSAAPFSRLLQSKRASHLLPVVLGARVFAVDQPIRLRKWRGQRSGTLRAALPGRGWLSARASLRRVATMHGPELRLLGADPRVLRPAVNRAMVVRFTSSGRRSHSVSAGRSAAPSSCALHRKVAPAVITSSTHPSRSRR